MLRMICLLSITQHKQQDKGTQNGFVSASAGRYQNGCDFECCSSTMDERLYFPNSAWTLLTYLILV